MKNKILYVNACVRKESRTNRLAKALLDKLGEYVELDLEKANLKTLDESRLNRRAELLSKGAFEDDTFELARQFAQADIIVVAAPYWDSSFPTIFKAYIENIYVTGIVSEYGENGMPHGLCKAEKLYYVTTAGGPYEPKFSYDYVRELCLNFFGIKETKLIFAENLDIEGSNPEEILDEAIKKIEV